MSPNLKLESELIIIYNHNAKRDFDTLKNSWINELKENNIISEIDLKIEETHNFQQNQQNQQYKLCVKMKSKPSIDHTDLKYFDDLLEQGINDNYLFKQVSYIYKISYNRRQEIKQKGFDLTLLSNNKIILVITWLTGILFAFLILILRG
jgi:hypothetical protein